LTPKKKRQIAADEILEIIAQVAELAGIDPDAVDPDWSATFTERILRDITNYEKIDLEKKKRRRAAMLAIRAAHEAILALDKEDQAKLERALTRGVLSDLQIPERSKRLIWISWADNLIGELADLTDDNPFPQSAAKPGRRAGTLKNWQMWNFVGYLWAMAKVRGGNLYASDKVAGGGTMIRALNLLRPLLPEGFLPEHLSTRAIEKIIKEFRRSPRNHWTDDNPLYNS
jgi:hypothetical protein